MKVNMIPYNNLSGNSGVVSYEIKSDSITIEFISGNNTFYLYTKDGIGSSNLKTMKQLAEEGRGLNSFINQSEEVKNGYSEKW